ncbi:hypothetical protein CALCODRAFT_405925, partial [Calocera cornea HHB12733]
PTKFPQICVEFLDPNMTCRIQPLDQGIIRCFKAHYHRLFYERALACDIAGQADLYKINQKEIMGLADEAGKTVGDTTVANCWRHSGIL